MEQYKFSYSTYEEKQETEWMSQAIYQQVRLGGLVQYLFC